MSMEERLEKAEKLVAEVKAELAAMRAEKRNWPERIEAGMVFRAYGSIIIATATSTDASMVSAVSVSGRSHGTTCYKWHGAPDVEYLGHARDILAIRTDAHEPTGAELVGKVCEFSDDGEAWKSKGECVAFGQNPAYPYRKAGGGGWWTFARLAK